MLNGLHQAHFLRLAIHHRQENHAEAFLHLRMLVELVQHNLLFRAPLELHHHPHAVAARFITNIGNVIHDLVIHQLGNTLHQLRLVYLEGNFSNDDGFAPLDHVLYSGFSAHHEAPPSMRVGSLDSTAAVDVGAGRKIRPFHKLEQVRELRRRIIDQGDGGIHDLRQVVRRNLGCHADRDAVRTVD